MDGTIVKGIAGFYYIKVNNKIIECKSRGKFRHDELSPMVGDRVDILLQGDTGVIEKIYPRSSRIIRPAVSNVTQAIVVFAVKNPDINEELLNKLLVSCEFNNLKAIVCFNKLDLELSDKEKSIENMVKSAGYEVIFLKAKEGYGIDKIKERLKGEITVLCGPSGVGKSTILNYIAGKELMETGVISDKLKRGKHTTRHSELIEIDGGFIVDTPGFSSFKIDFIEAEELQYYFPEFKNYLGSCKFTSCLHYKEPNCGIKKMVEEGLINRKRYNFYLKMLDEILNKKNIIR